MLSGHGSKSKFVICSSKRQSRGKHWLSVIKLDDAVTLKKEWKHKKKRIVQRRKTQEKKSSRLHASRDFSFDKYGESKFRNRVSELS